VDVESRQDGEVAGYSVAKADEPELMPWRSRLKGRLGARLFHGKGSAREEFEQAAVTKPTKSPASEQLAMRTAAVSDSFKRGESPPPVAKDGELDVPDRVGPTPEPTWPDPVVD
jgi:hypothetical protein